MPHPAESHVTLIGTVAVEPDFMVCANGAPRAGFRLAVPERRYDRAAAAWTTARVSFYSVVCWRALADHVGSSLGKGDPVIVTGRQRVVEWTRDGRRGTAVEVEAATVGHDLRYGLSQFRGAVRRRALPAGGGPPEDDPFVVRGPFEAAIMGEGSAPPAQGTAAPESAGAEAGTEAATAPDAAGTESAPGLRSVADA